MKLGINLHSEFYLVSRSLSNRIKYFVLLVILMMSLPIKSYSKNYYVKSTGNDNNTGLSDEQAWSTIAKVNVSSFSPGDTVFFNKGDTWRETLTIPSSGTVDNYITFGAYGKGDAPQILGSTEVTAWTNDAGNVWYSNNTVNDPYNMGEWTSSGNIYFKETDGVISWGRVKKATKGDLATEYDWIWISNHIYIYSPTDPNNRYSGVEVSQLATCITLNNKDYLTFDGIEVAYSGSTGIGEAWSQINTSGLIVRNCHIHHIGIKSSVGAYGLSLYHSNMLIQNNIIHDSGRRNISLNIYDRAIAVNNITIEGNTLFHGFHTTGIDISSGGSGTLSNIIIRNNLIYDDVTETLDGVESYQSNGIYAESVGTGSISDIYIYNNIVKYSTSCAILLLSTSSSYIYNNTIYGVNPNLVSGNGIFIGGGTNSVIKNNILYSNAVKSMNTGYRNMQVAKDAGTVISDYNLFYYEDVAAFPLAWKGTSYTTANWANYKSISGQDSHSPDPANPIFVSSSDYHLQAGSPAIDAGVFIPGISKDFEGVTSSNPPNIGCFETVASTVEPVYRNSSIENAAPSTLEMTYNLTLANIVPALSAFTVIVNSVARTVSSVAVSGTTVTLTLANAVGYGDVVTVTYTKPSSNPLQTSAGGQASSLNAQSVFNKVLLINTPPIVIVNYQSTSYSGFVSEINASGSYDVNNDILTFSWVVPDNIPLSSTTGSKIQYLSPVVDVTQKVQFILNVSDGKTTQSKTIPVEIVPNEHGLDIAEVVKVEASSYLAPNYPSNSVDGNIGTMWAVDGNNQWLLLELKELFSIQYVEIVFHPGQKKESLFDMLGSEDMVSWESILTKSNSCAFSGNLQVFDFPPSKTGKEFKYIKVIGHGNSSDTWNYISEFRIFGYKHKNPKIYEELPVKIFPNPAHEYINIRIDEATLKTDFIRIINFSGSLVFQEKVNPDIKDFQFPINLLKGSYIVQMGLGDLTLFSQKLIIIN